jgi:hypothetical protein
MPIDPDTGLAYTTSGPDFFNGWIEPRSPALDAPPEYGMNYVQITDSGHSFEMDDTPDRERIRLTHRIGTFIEMHPNGDEVHKVYGDGYEITVKNKNILVKGDCNITIEGDAQVHVMGNKREYIEGQYELHVKKSFTILAEESLNMTSKSDMTIRAGNGITGAMDIYAPDTVTITADLTVEGGITTEKLFSYGRVDAGTGVGAGPLGFVSVLGGLSIGIPAAIPFTILSSVLIAAGVQMTAPNSSFGFSQIGVMTAGWMTDLVNVSIFDCHFHIAPLGPTSPPIPFMV